MGKRLLTGLAGAFLSVMPMTTPAAVQSGAGSEAPLVMTDMRLHDPWFVADKASGTYFLFTRNEAAMTGDRRLGTMVYSSRDLKHWTRPRLAFVLPEDTWANAGSWAPEVHQWKGRWYLFTTVHNADKAIAGEGRSTSYRRATVLAVADHPDGPYRLLNDGEPIAPKERMTLDGTLYVDRKGKPWLVYAHDWLQTTVGTMEAIPLKDDLSASGPPRLLFRADEANWAVGQKQPDGRNAYVTDGPELLRTKAGTLLMLWSSYGAKGYVQALARSRSGEIDGPWEQLGPLLARDSGHGMLFHAFDGRLMMVLHRPFTFALGKLYEMRDTGDRGEVIREATELDGEAYPTHPCVPGRSPMEGSKAGC
ncbi:glycoside hydrolase family 43 protein [Sphingobium sp. H39-3-25]|uniref:glycoside hydrolase family 43 protein n=1 Tax=Sphingobium arseniciresistens TaxID=3030834 RepID=UPI0023B9F7D9|nr:glycoside hydrolase family 43 protein [Sphingobium arseniciresistens]